MNIVIDGVRVGVDRGPDREFFAALERSDHLKPFPGEVFSRSISVEEVRNIADQYPFLPA